MTRGMRIVVGVVAAVLTLALTRAGDAGLGGVVAAVLTGWLAWYVLGRVTAR